MTSRAHRRQFLATVAAGLVLAPVAAWLARPAPRAQMMSRRSFAVEKSDEEWSAALTPEQYEVLRDHGTEAPFTSPLNHETREGLFRCAGCGEPLFDAATKFDSGTGWPSFWDPRQGAVGTMVDHSWFMVRTEVHCARCGGHLGHVFPDGPKPTGLRYCINGLALRFEPTTGRT